MEEVNPEFSHRNSKAKFVRIDAKKRDGKGHAIVTCEKDHMGNHVKNYQKQGYDIINIREM